MDSNNLTKRERREQKKKNKQAAQTRKERKKLFTRIFIIAIIILVFFGLWQLVKNSATTTITDAEILKIKESDWVKNYNPGALTLIEYLDFQCPACQSYHPIVNQLTDEYEDKINLVVRHFPLTQIHKNAEAAGQAAEAAGKQNKFWEMYDLLFENQNDWANSNDEKELFISYAESLSLDLEKFKEDYDSDQVENKIDNDKSSGYGLGVQGTPTFFLDGKKIDNPSGLDEFKNLIDNLLETK